MAKNNETNKTSNSYNLKSYSQNGMGTTDSYSNSESDSASNSSKNKSSNKSSNKTSNKTSNNSGSDCNY